MRLAMVTAAIVCLVLTGVSVQSQTTKRFWKDDPLQVDPDDLPIPKPQAIKLSQIYDIMESTFGRRPKKDQPIPPSENANSAGQVPNSSWFTDRLGKQNLAMDKLVRGSDQLKGPDQSRPWLLVGMKVQGITPGFTVQDGRGDIYFIKFDPPKYPHLTTSTEVIATKFFYAFGYNVPENYLAFIRREDIQIGNDWGSCGQACEVLGHEHKVPLFVDEEGKERPVTDRDLDKIFKRVYQAGDGRTPVVASRRLRGSPLGPFKYYGTRSDDPNDIFDHENRRELRGLRVFAAWLNHDDSRSINSLDMYEGEPGKGFVKHYLLDFGSCLGSGSVRKQSKRAGNEYFYELKPALKAGASLGIWDRSWRHVKYPDYPSIGRFEGDYFQPQLWKPEYPNPAFERMQIGDAFWATSIIAKFTDEMVRVLVGTGQVPDPEAEEYLVETLLKRRDKILGYYLSQTNPLDAFQVEPSAGGSRLMFDNLGVKAGLVAASSYQYRWFRFNNETGSTEPLTTMAVTEQPALAVPDDKAAYLMVRITTPSVDYPSWEKPVDVFVWNTDPSPKVIGVDRTH